MHKFTFAGLACLVTVVLAAFGAPSWSDPAAVEHASAVSPFNLTVSAGPIPEAPTADTF
jgi:hypothetical protein